MDYEILNKHKIQPHSFPNLTNCLSKNPGEHVEGNSDIFEKLQHCAAGNIDRVHISFISRYFLSTCITSHINYL